MVYRKGEISHKQTSNHDRLCSKATRRGVRQMLAIPSQLRRPEAYTLAQVKTYHYGYDESMSADG